MPFHGGSMEDVPGGLETTKRSFAILETLHEMDGARAADLVERFGFAKSTVHNHLTTLEHLGYIVREGDIYFISLAFREFGEYARTRKQLYRSAEQQVRRLSEETDAEVDFCVEENGRPISVCHEINYSFDKNFEGQNIFYMHTSAVGKAILAELPETRIKEIINQWGLPRKTSNSITSCEKLFEELETVRRQGYATNDAETKEGLRAIGIAVQYPSGQPCGAMSVNGPTYRLNDAMLDGLVDVLREHVNRLEDEIASHYSVSPDNTDSRQRDSRL